MSKCREDPKGKDGVRPIRYGATRVPGMRLASRLDMEGVTVMKLGRQELREKMERGDDFALVEVLDADEYERAHLPGAINVPCDAQFEEKATRVLPDRSQTIVVYCRDVACDASTTAADRLERLGYRDVWDYEAGKSDWMDAGLRIVESGQS